MDGIRSIDPMAPRTFPVIIKHIPAHALMGYQALARECDRSAQMRTLGEPMTDEELHARAELIAKVIETRNKLNALNHKVEELQLALKRFAARRAGLS
jgi:ribosomal 50S subunit-associated protein YjgA (DUF615 family)